LRAAGKQIQREFWLLGANHPSAAELNKKPERQNVLIQQLKFKAL